MGPRTIVMFSRMIVNFKHIFCHLLSFNFYCFDLMAIRHDMGGLV